MKGSGARWSDSISRQRGSAHAIRHPGESRDPGLQEHASCPAKTLPVIVASQTGSQGINWWSMAALSTAAIAPLAIIGVFLERYIVKGLTAGAVK